jgi:hypothetical protein
MTWQPIKESQEAMEIVIGNSRREATVDMAFRRLQKFRAKPGAELVWEGVSSPLGDRRAKPFDPQGGTVVVDKDGIFVLKGLKVGRDLALSIRVKSGR